MTDLSISHGLAGSPRVVSAYIVPDAREEFALAAEEATPNGRPVIRGDRLGLPEVLEFRIRIDEGALADSADRAYLIVEEADTATAVEWHEGSVPVYPLARARVRQEFEGVGVELTLWFPRKDSAFVSVGDGTPYDGVDLETGL